MEDSKAKQRTREILKKYKTPEEVNKLEEEDKLYESLTDNLKLAQIQENKEKFKVIAWKDFNRLEFEEPKWIVDKIIPENGLVAIVGAPESGKSFFSVFLAITIAKGEPLFGIYPTIQTPVLLLDQENQETWIKKRINSFNPPDDFPFFIYRRQEKDFRLEDGDSFNELKLEIQKRGIGLLVIDTLRITHNRDENTSTEMKPIMDRLRELSKITAVIVIHHNRKTDKFNRNKADGEDMMGSIIIRGGLDSQLTLVKVNDVSESFTKIRVTHTKSRYSLPIPPFEMTLEEFEKGLTFAFQGRVEEDTLKKDDAKETILIYLQDKSLARQEILDHLVEDEICSQRTAEKALAELNDEGRVIHTDSKPHVYSLPEQTNDNSANRNSIYTLRNAETTTSSKDNQEQLSTPSIDSLSEDQQLAIGKMIFGEGTRWDS